MEKARVYIERCNRKIRSSILADDPKEKKYWMGSTKRDFDRAWKAKNEDGCTDETENIIYWLKNNFYPVIPKVPYDEKDSYFEGRILANQESEYF